MEKIIKLANYKSRLMKAVEYIKIINYRKVYYQVAQVV